MRYPLRLLPFAAGLCLLAACNIGKPTEWPDTEVPDYPDKTKVGADKVVCMVNNNLSLEVYREVHSGLFDDDEVDVHRRLYYINGDTVAGYMISAERELGNGNTAATSIHLAVRVDSPKLNTPYPIYTEIFGTYGIGENNYYYVDTDASELRFSRIDSLIAAGEFIFRAMNKYNDTVEIRGYFDIPFERK